MRCSDVHRNLPAFLDGSLEATENESIRAHLDRCPSCAGAITNERLLGAAELEDVSSPGLFTEKLLGNFAEPTISLILFRYFCAIFAASAGLGVSIFAFWRHFSQPKQTAVARLDWDSLANLPTSLPWLEQITASPAFHYALWALAATILSALLIVLVDLPRRRRLDPIHLYKHHN